MHEAEAEVSAGRARSVRDLTGVSESVADVARAMNSVIHERDAATRKAQQARAAAAAEARERYKAQQRASSGSSAWGSDAGTAGTGTSAGGGGGGYSKPRGTRPSANPPKHQHHYHQRHRRSRDRDSGHRHHARGASYGSTKSDTAASAEQTHYQVLGIAHTATAVEVKKAYHKLALKYHPDKAKAGDDIEEFSNRFKRVSEAYSVLSDASQRTSYDRDQVRKRSTWGM